MKESATNFVVKKVPCPSCSKSRLFDAMLGDDKVAVISIRCPNCKSNVRVMIDRLQVYAKALGH